MLRNRLPFSLSIAAFVMLVMGLVITAILFVGVRRLEQDKVDTDFQQRAMVRIVAIKRGMEDAVQVLTVTNQLFATFNTVSREQFHDFTQPLLARYPYIQAFNFHRIITAAERPAFEAERRVLFPDFVVTELVGTTRVPAAARDMYRVVDYIEPLKGNERALGFDAASYGFQVDAMRRATETGLPSATGLLRLLQESGTQRGLLVLMPVYRKGAALDDVESRRRALIGDTAAVFRVGDLISKILGADNLMKVTGIDLSVYAGDAIDERNLSFRDGRAPPAATAASWLPGWLFYDRSDTIDRSFEIAGKPWHIVVSSQPVWFTRNHAGSLLALILGSVFSLLTTGYLQTLTAHSRRIQLLVDQRTTELRRANEMLTDDIAARVRAEQALQLRERAIEASPNAIIITNASGPHYVFEYVNPAFERITGYPENEVIGRSGAMLWGGDGDQRGVDELRSAVGERREGHAIVRTYRKDGTLFWSDVYVAPVRDETGEIAHFVVALYDITETKQYEAELEFQANRDALTGLANRNLLRDRLSQSIGFAARYDHPIWVAFIDLDRFKLVNDTLGHRAGDLLLKQVAERLQATVRETDTVARLGGDEFVLVLPEREDEQLGAGVVRRIMEAVGQPLVIDGHEFVVTCSIGVVIYPADGTDPDTLIKHADIAMYRAKETGRNNFQFYTATMNQHVLERLRIEGDMRNAIERNEFVLHYQPQVDLRTGFIVGMEALIRWEHPDLGMVPPIRFIGLAEETGLIVPIGAWVIRTACMQNVAWARAGLGHLRVAVNLSARQFYQQDLVQSIAAVLQETGLSPHYLEIELTESLVMTDVDHAVGILRDLKTLGVQVSIDDFGTGYSSLAYLKRFPIDVLKIDQSFVADITVDPDDAAIVVSIISLAHSLRLQVIAEGVETEAQLTYLKRHGCDQMQGYYFSRPVAPDAFEQILREGRHLSNIHNVVVIDDAANQQ